MRGEPLYILRCACRDWPCHPPEAVQFPGGRCGSCNERAELVMEPYSGPNHVDH